MAERQDLDKLRRQQKVLRDGLTTVGDKIQQTEGKRDKLSRDIEVLEERKEVVSDPMMKKVVPPG